jgi:uncharacterized protein YcbX
VRVVELFVYPIKSARGIAVPSAALERRGFALDRRWMLVDEKGSFLTQRALPRMALLEVSIGEDHLAVRAPAMGEIAVPLASDGAVERRTRVTVWDDTCDAILAPDDVSCWFTQALGVPCRLVHMPDDSLRQADPDFSTPQDLVGFADGFPLLLTSVSSLEDLNARLERPVPMNRFRPNVVVSGGAPFEEDVWTRVEACGVTFRVAKPCARCAITTVDQQTAETGKEPLRTLATFRAANGGVMFGQNLLHDCLGTLRVGAEVAVLV